MKKKQLFRGALLAMASLFLMGCPSDGGGDDPIVSSEQILVSPTSLDFSSAAGVQEHVALTANCKWTITNIPNWLIVNPKEGSGNATITLETASQNTGNERSVQLKISGLERSVTMTVRQRGDGNTPSGGLPVIVSFGVSNPTATGFSMALTFTSNPEATEYGVCFSSTNTMPTINDTKAIVNIPSTGKTFTGNVTRDDFQPGATYYVRGFATNSNGTSYSSNVQTVTIPSAAAPSLTLSTTALSFAAAETTSKTFTATVSPTTATVTAQSSNTALCTVSVSGSGATRTITVTPKANTSSSQRTAVITVTATANGQTTSQTVNVTQAGDTGSAPVITAFSLSNPTNTAFTFTMSFTANPAATEYGVCYSDTETMPTINNYREFWSSSSTGRSNISATVDRGYVPAGSKLYVRAYAKNSYGTSYSEVKTIQLTASNPNTPNAGDNPTPNVPSRSVNK